jgi:hypothetical protein
MSDQPQQVSVRVKLADLVRKMQEPKDIRIVMSKDGTFTAICKTCQMNLQVGDTMYGEMHLVWHRCPRCERVSFSVQQNLERDARIAEAMGGSFPYEIYFLKDLPPQLPPPAEWRDT